ncbi:hypothetical protein PspLS_00661, partial [Pyricularia sp. CBS 133598]
LKYIILIASQDYSLWPHAGHHVRLPNQRPFRCILQKEKKGQKQRYGLPDGNPPISIFEHRRNHKTGRRETPAPIFPSSFGQVLTWLDARLEAAQTTKTPDEDCDSSEASSRVWAWRYSISRPFYWDMLWVHLPSTRTSIGIVRTWIEGYSAGFSDLERAVLNLPGPTLNHPLLLGVSALQVAGTGLHDYDYLRETDAAVLGVPVVGGDLAGTTKRILGASANLTGWQHAAEQMEAFARFLVAEICAFGESVAEVVAATVEKEEALTSPTPTAGPKGARHKQQRQQQQQQQQQRQA